eukprot:629672-Rhodomonas_salina.4
MSCAAGTDDVACLLVLILVVVAIAMMMAAVFVVALITTLQLRLPLLTMPSGPSTHTARSYLRGPPQPLACLQTILEPATQHTLPHMTTSLRDALNTCQSRCMMPGTHGKVSAPALRVPHPAKAPPQTCQPASRVTRCSARKASTSCFAASSSSSSWSWVAFCV